MLITTLLALAAVFGGLWLTGTEMNITSMMGMTMIVGIVTEVSIFYYSEYADIADESDPLDRLVRAGKDHASNRYDDFGGDLRSATFGFGHRSRCGHAATASDSYYFGSRRAAAAGFDRSAVAARAFTRGNTVRICRMTWSELPLMRWS
jgi:hypothetical protein